MELNDCVSSMVSFQQIQNIFFVNTYIILKNDMYSINIITYLQIIFRLFFDRTLMVMNRKKKKKQTLKKERHLRNSKAVVFRTQSRGKDSKEKGEVIACPQ